MPDHQTQLVILGTGTPNIEPTRFQSSLAVIANETPYLVDCGGGTLQRIAQARSRGVHALSLPHLTRLFLTHLHPDHTAGLPDLLIAPWVEGRTETLHIYGPRGTEKLVTHLLSAYETGIAEHRDGIAPINHPLAVQVHEIKSGEIYADENLTVTAFRVQHGGLDAYGFKFVTEDKTIVISGDTCPTPTLVAQARGCDILVHEVYSADRLATRPLAWQNYHRAVHTSTVELAEIAQQTRPRLLVLTHQLLWGTTDEDLLREITTRYDGPVISAADLDVY